MNKKILRNPIKKCKTIKKRLQTANVLKALIKMENNQKQQEAQTSATTSEVVVKSAEEIQNEFLNTGRIGRRNALGDILKNEHVTTNVGDLPSKLSALTTNDPTNQPGNSGTNQHSAGSNEPNK